MTTAHKPTYHPAIGRVHAGGWRFDAKKAQVHSRDLARQMDLKLRTDLVGKPTDHQALKQALIDSERRHKQGIKDERSRQGLLEDDEPMKLEPPAAASSSEIPNPDDADDEGGPSSAAAVDLSKFDDDDDVPVGGGAGAETESSSDDEDEDAELARELDLIRREREETKLKAAQAEAEAAEAAAAAAVHSNPLLAAPSSAPFASAAAAFAEAHGTGVKRRWDDDVVFKGQAKGDLSSAPKKRFINDTIRSDFHRSFLNRFVH